METRKMTIHRALSELKLIDAKIEKQISELYPTSIAQKGKLIDGYLTEETFKSNSLSKYQSITDLIALKTTIKSKIVEANGKTKLIVGGKEMTISDAITFKGVIELKKKFALALAQKHKSAIALMNKNNEAVDKNLQILLEHSFGKEQVKATKDDIDAVSKPFLENNTFNLIDPLDGAKKIEELENEINSFEAEVDACLSEVNSITFIEV